MPWPLLIPLISSGLSFAGGLIKNKQSSSTTPNYGPLQGLITELIKKRLGTSADLGGYTAGGMQQINHNFDLAGQAQGNDLTARGLSTSPVAGAVDATRQAGRVASLSQFQNSIPLLQRELQAQDLGLAGSLFRGGTTTGEGGGGLGGGLENLSQMLGYFYGRGAFGKRGGYNNMGIPQSYEPSDTYGYG